LVELLFAERWAGLWGGAELLVGFLVGDWFGIVALLVVVGFGLLGSGFNGVASGLLFEHRAIIIVIIIPVVIIVIIP
jgi:hypothetical protein